MPPPQLCDLPVDISRQVCTYLPSHSALAFLLVSRSIYQGCNDWIVWREVIRNSSNFPHRIPEAHAQDPRAWKQLVIADSKACRSGLDGVDIEEWLPHLVALNHSCTLSIDAAALHRICDPIFNTSIFAAGTELVPYDFSSNVESPHNNHNWRLAQAASFCLTARLLSDRCPPEPSTRLESVPWFRFPPSTQQEPKEAEKLLIMQHALANRAIGFFCVELRYALANRVTASQSTAGLHSPPTATAIPLSIMMKPPLPFSPNSLNGFIKCHLPSMTDPSFFISDEWTGYSSISGSKKTTFNGIGGKNFDLLYHSDVGQWSGLGQFPQGRDFEPVVRFRLAEPYDGGDRYTLQSNNFYSEGELHILTIEVQRSIGRLKITHWHRLRPDFMTTEAVITPFGIISGLVPHQCWLWLWKTKWSERRELSVGEASNI